MCGIAGEKCRKRIGWKLFTWLDRESRKLDALTVDFLFETDKWITSPSGPGFFLYSDKAHSSRAWYFDEERKVKIREAHYSQEDENIIIAQKIFIPSK